MVHQRSVDLLTHCQSHGIFRYTLILLCNLDVAYARGIVPRRNKRALITKKRTQLDVFLFLKLANVASEVNTPYEHFLWLFRTRSPCQHTPGRYILTFFNNFSQSSAKETCTSNARHTSEATLASLRNKKASVFSF